MTFVFITKTKERGSLSIVNKFKQVWLSTRLVILIDWHSVHLRHDTIVRVSILIDWDRWLWFDIEMSCESIRYELFTSTGDRLSKTIETKLPVVTHWTYVKLCSFCPTFSSFLLDVLMKQSDNATIGDIFVISMNLSRKKCCLWIKMKLKMKIRSTRLNDFRWKSQIYLIGAELLKVEQIKDLCVSIRCGGHLRRVFARQRKSWTKVEIELSWISSRKSMVKKKKNLSIFSTIVSKLGKDSPSADCQMIDNEYFVGFERAVDAEEFYSKINEENSDRTNSNTTEIDMKTFAEQFLIDAPSQKRKQIERTSSNSETQQKRARRQIEPTIRWTNSSSTFDDDPTPIFDFIDQQSSPSKPKQIESNEIPSILQTLQNFVKTEPTEVRRNIFSCFARRKFDFIFFLVVSVSRRRKFTDETRTDRVRSKSTLTKNHRKREISFCFFFSTSRRDRWISERIVCEFFFFQIYFLGKIRNFNSSDKNFPRFLVWLNHLKHF